MTKAARKNKTIRIQQSLELQIQQHLLNEKAQGRKLSFSDVVELAINGYLKGIDPERN
ncbi:hypothetical protein [Thermoleptolyngbya sp.]